MKEERETTVSLGCFGVLLVILATGFVFHFATRDSNLAKRLDILERHAPNVTGSNIVQRLQILETVVYRLPTNIVVLDDGAVLDETSPTLRTFRSPVAYLEWARTIGSFATTTNQGSYTNTRWIAP